MKVEINLLDFQGQEFFAEILISFFRTCSFMVEKGVEVVSYEKTVFL